MFKSGRFAPLFFSVLSAVATVSIHLFFSVNSNVELALIGLSVFLLFYLKTQTVTADKKIKSQTTIWALLFFTFFLVNSSYYVASVFTGKGITQQVLDHLSASSLKFAPNEWLDYHYGLILFGIVFTLSWFNNPQNTSPPSNRNWRTSGLLLIAFISHPAFYDLAKLSWYKLRYQGVDKQLSKQYRKGAISDKRLFEVKKLIDDKTPRNIIVIYLEGYERAALDPVQFPNLANNFRMFEQQGSTYGRFNQMMGANHTIAGIVSSQCGVPYATTGGEGNSVNSGGGNYFMPHIQCLADVTKKLGYKNVYYQGGSLDFTRKRAFFKAHGYDEVKGVMEPWDNIPVKNRSSWGIHDDIILGFATERIDQLMNAESNQPFMFTTLTLDTHDAAGSRRMSQSCKKIEKNFYIDRREHVIQDQLLCSDALVANFVNSVLDKYPDQIDIYLVSDHLPHAISTIPSLRGKSDRELIFIGLNKSKLKKNRQFSHLDIAATILDEITDGEINHLGLGVSLHSSKPTLTERFGLEALNTKLHSSLAALASMFWDYPTLKDSTIQVDTDSRLVKIGAHTFPLPVAFELSNGHKILNYFSTEINTTLKTSKISENLVYLDKCTNVARYQPNKLPANSSCILAGKLGAQSLMVRPFISGENIPFSDIKPSFQQRSSRANYVKRLFEPQEHAEQRVASVASMAISPLLEATFSVGLDPNDLMVTSYRDPSELEKFKGFKNHLKQEVAGSFLFALDKGAINLVKTWSECSQEPLDISKALEMFPAPEYILMTGDKGWRCDYPVNIIDTKGLRNALKPVQKSQGFIAHIDTSTGELTTIISKKNQDAQLRLVNQSKYGAPAVHSF